MPRDIWGRFRAQKPHQSTEQYVYGRSQKATQPVDIESFGKIPKGKERIILCRIENSTRATL